MPLATVTCQHTGLSRPECSCQHCLTDLMNRFAPPPYGQAGLAPVVSLHGSQDGARLTLVGSESPTAA